MQKPAINIRKFIRAVAQRVATLNALVAAPNTALVGLADVLTVQSPQPSEWYWFWDALNIGNPGLTALPPLDLADVFDHLTSYDLGLFLSLPMNGIGELLEGNVFEGLLDLTQGLVYAPADALLYGAIGPLDLLLQMI